jgi:hypothetical protein
MFGLIVHSVADWAATRARGAVTLSVAIRMSFFMDYSMQWQVFLVASITARTTFSRMPNTRAISCLVAPFRRAFRIAEALSGVMAIVVI